ncbi:hypothetical protein [Proteiniborus sp. DW1]|uniref:hypothetical protein n=1 Tax=Proteiniborus sp. DW1 TaxID=1889883 RepID=UPI00117A45B1|nr:hypothetical protein [Proteiniborus sp. DW1]
MMYTILDIIAKLIEIDKESLELYKTLKESSNVNQRVKLAAGVFAREEERHIKVYEDLKNEMSKFEDITIDFDIYDSVSKIILEFKKGMTFYEVDEVKELLNNTLAFRKKKVALIISIQGLLVRKIEDTKTSSYKALTRIIAEEEEHIKMIETFL